MNTLEALLAVLLVMGLVFTLIQAQAEIHELVSDASLKEKIQHENAVGIKLSEKALGKGRSKTGYTRWYFV